MTSLFLQATLALLAVAARFTLTDAQACQVRVLNIFLEGNQPAPYEGYPGYNVSVPLDGSTIEITNPLVVYSIITGTDNALCTFTGADGTVNKQQTQQIDIIPETQVSVSCVPYDSGYPEPSSTTVSYTTCSGSTSTAVPSTATSLTPSSTSISPLPPYPITTASLTTATATGAPASTGLGATGTVGGKNTAAALPFTGTAPRDVKSIGASLCAIFGIIAIF